MVNLSNLTNAVIADAQGLGTITNDDAPAGSPTITVASTTVSPGGVITLTIANGPANPMDWVGLHRSTDADGTFLNWMYLSGTKTPPNPSLSNVTIQLAAPTTPGTYNARSFANNGYTKLATSVTITVQ